MPPDSYRLYWIERAKSPAEIQRADEQAARLVSAVSWLSRAIGGPPEPRAGHTRPCATAHPGW